MLDPKKLWKALKNFGYPFPFHVAVDKMYYSVPQQYIKDEVDVRMAAHVIEVFYKHERTASHKRLKGRPGKYSTVTGTCLMDITGRRNLILYWNLKFIAFLI